MHMHVLSPRYLLRLALLEKGIFLLLRCLDIGHVGFEG